MMVSFKYDSMMKIMDLKYKIWWKSVKNRKCEAMIFESFNGQTYSSFDIFFGEIQLDNDWEIAACGIAPGDVLILPLEHRMTLELDDHRGHASDDMEASQPFASCHPDNLLDGKAYTRYASTRCESFEDWLIFKSPNTFVPRRIMMRNGNGCAAITSMCVSWSDDGKEWKDMIQINGIEDGSDFRDRQWFALNADEANAAKNRMRFVKLHKITNRIRDESHCNVLKEFGVFGMGTRWDVLAAGHSREMGAQMVATIPDDVVQVILIYLHDCDAEVQAKLQRASKSKERDMQMRRYWKRKSCDSDSSAESSCDSDSESDSSSS